MPPCGAACQVRHSQDVVATACQHSERPECIHTFRWKYQLGEDRGELPVFYISKLLNSLKNHGNTIFPLVSVAVCFFKLRGKVEWKLSRIGRGSNERTENISYWGTLGIELLIGYNSGYEIKNKTMSGVCGPYGGEEKWVQSFDGETEGLAHFDS